MVDIAPLKMKSSSLLPVLETVCPECNGDGGCEGYEAGWITCYKCGGAGHVPTPFGERVLELVFHNSKRIVGAAKSD